MNFPLLSDGNAKPCFPIENDIYLFLEETANIVESIKTSATKQMHMKQSLGMETGSARYYNSIREVTQYVTSFSKFVDDCCSRIYVLLTERIRVVSLYSSEAIYKTNLQKITSLLISSLYWLRMYAKETIGLLPYLIGVSLNSQDIHNIVSSVDSVEKLIDSGCLKQFYTTITSTCGEVLLVDNSYGKHETTHVHNAIQLQYSLLIEPSSSVTLLKALNNFADIRAQLSSNDLISYLQRILEMSDPPSGATKVEDTTKEDEPTADGNDVRVFHETFSSAFAKESEMAKALINCFSESSGFVQSLSKKSVRKSIDETLEELNIAAFDNSESAEALVTNSVTSRRSKGIIWGDAVDSNVQNRLQAIYMNWYFSRLKSLILGKSLFAMSSSNPKANIAFINWSLNWNLMRQSCFRLNKILQNDLIEGSSRELIGLVLFSTVTRSCELQNSALIDNMAELVHTDQLVFLSSQDGNNLGCHTKTGRGFYVAIEEISNSRPDEFDKIPKSLLNQLVNLQLMSIRSLLDLFSKFLSYRCGLFLARKNYGNLYLIMAESETVVNRFRTAINNYKIILKEMTFSSEVIENLADSANSIESSLSQFRDILLAKLCNETKSYLASSMPTLPSRWGMKKTNNQTTDRFSNSQAKNGYVRFSVQPYEYTLGLFRTCLIDFIGPTQKLILHDSLSLGQISFASQLLCDLVSTVFMEWLKFIQEKRVKFSPAGVRQLEADFQNLQFLVDQEISNWSKNSSHRNSQDRYTILAHELKSHAIYYQLRSIIYIMLSKTADFNRDAVTPEIQVAEPLNPSGSGEVSVDQRRVRKARRRRRSGKSPLHSTDSEQTVASTRNHSIPFGADAWLQLIDDWSSSRRQRTRQSRSDLHDNSQQVNIVCTRGCVPLRFRRGVSPV